ncbi:hypothetical protein [Polaribacter sp. HL-MS24]|uniref:hypothetical protein n=1 Tax=Polaribacter sp. HL-MS24 TaxID=3077735 RepID=UPI00293482FF|nr:hypothetical protein [Polaribacter sp. HL-MS24]WOC40715.1 hypothetical protein RRF69_02710 [Polaribacter sp. HL-MS24]
MKKWLLHYEFDTIKEITTLGLFHWDFKPNRRKREKPRRIPRVGGACKLIELSFKISIYFFEIDARTLHVYESLGFSLAGSNVTKEYIFEGEKFTEKSVLLNSIT